MAKTKELKSLLWHKGFKPHAGWETVVLTKKKFSELRGLLHPEQVQDPTIAFVTEIDWLFEDKKGKRFSVPQKYLVLREDAGPEIRAHEEAHTDRWEYIKQLRSLGIEEYVRDEVLAWLGAQKKRGRKLRTAWLVKVGYQALSDFPGESPLDVVNLIDAIIKEEGYPGLTDENKEKLLEDLEGLNEGIKSRRQKSRSKARKNKHV